VQTAEVLHAFYTYPKPRRGSDLMRTNPTIMVLVAVVFFSAVFWRGPSSVAQDPLERLERQVRSELSEVDSTRRPESVQPVPDDHRPGYFGIIADDRQLPRAGVRILHVAAGGPAARAGLRVGDLITAIDGHPLRQMRDLAQVMAGSRAGKTLRVVVQRDDQSREVPVTLDQRPPKRARLLPDFGRIPEAAVAPGARSTDQATTATSLGLRIAPLTEAARRQRNLPVVAGVLVTGVIPGSPAQRAGVSLGAVIVAIGSQPTHTPERFDQLIADAVPTGAIELTYYDHGQLTDTRLRLGTVPPSAGAQGAAPLPAPQLPLPESVLDRLKQLERRVEQLQRRIEQLEEGL
jgi:membrane-associated protease RseP (regulator of RpoE activity)